MLSQTSHASKYLCIFKWPFYGNVLSQTLHANEWFVHIQITTLKKCVVTNITCKYIQMTILLECVVTNIIFKWMICASKEICCHKHHMQVNICVYSNDHFMGMCCHKHYMQMNDLCIYKLPL